MYFGALGKIRTPDPQIRSLVLYPAELRAQSIDMDGFSSALQHTFCGGKSHTLKLSTIGGNCVLECPETAT